MAEPIRISIVTPNYNQAAFLEQTILSVLSQGYPALEFIIIDGGSTDGSVEIIKKYADKLHYWVSEKDNGLYDALQKGFSVSTGEIMGWLNSDDLLHRQSLFTLAEIFSTHPDIDWLQGYPNVADEQGRILFHRKPIGTKHAFYCRAYRQGLFIQQESTYWRRNLWSNAGGTISTAYKYAGDFELWMRFFQHAQLYNTSALIGTFRIREGQLSANGEGYLQECDRIIEHFLQQLSKEEKNAIQKTMKAGKLKDKYPLLKRLGIIDKIFRSAPAGERSIDYDFGNKKFIKRAE